MVGKQHLSKRCPTSVPIPDALPHGEPGAVSALGTRVRDLLLARFLEKAVRHMAVATR